ncbi:hypothetical protein GGE45_001662 [Rhizobium aethiopicum]|uniref:Uncharacterized protein n=1 Tax=Rhizobium aethiopicum TaxID=1138170 RepID=A0A7W6MJK4_9HYPH|nr:hypothetical protein [Rhizobium aethiopicum]MBB4193077.1 hypothetical protein [Rhizobium aethiopicum]MBB4579338.1 hypothetical protein [Rhizobium aethiopicum]
MKVVVFQWPCGTPARQGFIGQAYRGAKAAYERNIWSKVWFRRMRDAKDRESFWQSSVMLSKIVDARLDVWSFSLGSGSEVSDAFELTVKAELERRIEKWQKEREKKLFGDATPSSAFLSDPLPRPPLSPRLVPSFLALSPPGIGRR